MAFSAWDTSRCRRTARSSTKGNRISPSHGLTVGIGKLLQNMDTRRDRGKTGVKRLQFTAKSGRLQVEHFSSFPLLAGRYRILGVLGQGAFSITVQAVDEWETGCAGDESSIAMAGRLLRARESVHQHLVAIKVMHAQYSQIGIQEVDRMQDAGCGEWDASSWEQLAAWLAPRNPIPLDPKSNCWEAQTRIAEAGSCVSKRHSGRMSYQPSYPPYIESDKDSRMGRSPPQAGTERDPNRALLMHGPEANKALAPPSTPKYLASSLASISVVSGVNKRSQSPSVSSSPLNAKRTQLPPTTAGLAALKGIGIGIAQDRTRIGALGRLSPVRASYRSVAPNSVSIAGYKKSGVKTDEVQAGIELATCPDSTSSSPSPSRSPAGSNGLLSLARLYAAGWRSRSRSRYGGNNVQIEALPLAQASRTPNQGHDEGRTMAQGVAGSQVLQASSLIGHLRIGTGAGTHYDLPSLAGTKRRRDLAGPVVVTVTGTSPNTGGRGGDGRSSTGRRAVESSDEEDGNDPESESMAARAQTMQGRGNAAKRPRSHASNGAVARAGGAEIAPIVEGPSERSQNRPALAGLFEPPPPNSASPSRSQGPSASASNTASASASASASEYPSVGALHGGEQRASDRRLDGALFQLGQDLPSGAGAGAGAEVETCKSEVMRADTDPYHVAPEHAPACNAPPVGLRPMRDRVDQGLVGYLGSFGFHGHMCIVMELRGPSLLTVYDLQPAEHLLGNSIESASTVSGVQVASKGRGSEHDVTSSRPMPDPCSVSPASLGRDPDPTRQPRDQASARTLTLAPTSTPAPIPACRWEAVARVARRLFTALAHLERRGIMHADIKPDNILLGLASAKALLAQGTAERRAAEAAVLSRKAENASIRMRSALLQGVPASVGVKQCDRALAALKDSALASAAATAGAVRAEELVRACRENPSVVLADLGNSFSVRDAASVYEVDYQLQPAGYRAPEIIVGDRIGCPADVFSVGVVLLELCAGQAGMLLPNSDDLRVAKTMLTTDAEYDSGPDSSKRPGATASPASLERIALLVRMYRTLGRIGASIWEYRAADQEDARSAQGTGARTDMDVDMGVDAGMGMGVSMGMGQIGKVKPAGAKESGSKFLTDVRRCLAVTGRTPGCGAVVDPGTKDPGNKPTHAGLMRKLRAIVSRSRQRVGAVADEGVWAPPVLTDLLARCLDVDWRSRITAVEALCHPFLLDCAPCPVVAVGRKLLVHRTAMVPRVGAPSPGAPASIAITTSCHNDAAGECSPQAQEPGPATGPADPSEILSTVRSGSKSRSDASVLVLSGEKVLQASMATSPKTGDGHAYADRFDIDPTRAASSRLGMLGRIGRAQALAQRGGYVPTVASSETDEDSKRSTGSNQWYEHQNSLERGSQRSSERAGGSTGGARRPPRGVAVLARQRMLALQRYDEQLARAVGRAMS